MTKPFQSSLSLSQRTTDPSACEVTKRLERDGVELEVAEGSSEGDDGSTVGEGGSQRIDVTGEEVMQPDLLKRE